MTAASRTGPISASESETNAPMAGQKNLVIVGATGMVGGYALRYALEHPAAGRVTIIGRKRVGISHPKLKEVLHQDFADCSALAQVLTDQQAAIFLPGCVYRGGTGHRAPHDNSGLHDRIRAGSPWQQPGRSVRLLGRGWRGPDGTKSDVLRTLQGRGRERAAREGLCQRLCLPTGVHLPGDAAAGTEFRLSPVARDLPCVSGAISQPGHSSRRLGPSYGGGRGAENRGTSRAHFREPRHPSHCRVAAARGESEARCRTAMVSKKAEEIVVSATIWSSEAN
jgi:hypothetical protein